MNQVTPSPPIPVLGVIPARWHSSRFPGKPLAMVRGIPMVIHVYRQAAQVLPWVVIATDDSRIATTAAQYGAECMMTSSHHASGTDRCAEVAGRFRNEGDAGFLAIMNIQGDEPLISGRALSLLLQEIMKPGTGIATLIRREYDPDEMANPNRVKVVCDIHGRALYFSRHAIPYLREPLPPEFKPAFYTHIGVYAYKTDILSRLHKLTPGYLETAESLEQLTWLENGYEIKCCETDYQGFGIDTPEDLSRLLGSGLI